MLWPGWLALLGYQYSRYRCGAQIISAPSCPFLPAREIRIQSESFSTLRLHMVSPHSVVVITHYNSAYPGAAAFFYPDEYTNAFSILKSRSSGGLIPGIIPLFQLDNGSLVSLLHFFTSCSSRVLSPFTVHTFNTLHHSTDCADFGSHVPRSRSVIAIYCLNIVYSHIMHG